MYRVKIVEVSPGRVQRIEFEGKIIDVNCHSGGSRSIFFTDKFVIKFDRAAFQYSSSLRTSVDFQCYQEWRTWRDTISKSKRYKKFFVPAVQFGATKCPNDKRYYFAYVIQERIVVSRGNVDKYYGSGNPADLVLDNVCRRFSLGDIHSGNMTFSDNGKTFQIFDYAL